MIKRVLNPDNRFIEHSYEWLDVPPPAQLEVFEERSKSIITENKSPDIGFSFSVNPYRGCFHACAYCYARPTHQYLDFGAGTDFERKLIAKINAPELLEATFMKKSWEGDVIVFSGITDCYQPLEVQYELTKRCLEVCLKFRNPVAIITKGALIERDADLLAELASETYVRVTMSIAFDDDELSKLIEPGAPRPSRRFRTMEVLASRGIEVGIGLAPVIPGLNDSDIAKLIQRAKDAGARSAFMTLLRLPAEVEDVFIERLETNLGSRAKKVLSGIRAMKGGKLNRSQFGTRMRGEGNRWDVVEWLFESACERAGMNWDEKDTLTIENEREKRASFHRPERQLKLF